MASQLELALKASRAVGKSKKKSAAPKRAHSNNAAAAMPGMWPGGGDPSVDPNSPYNRSPDYVKNARDFQMRMSEKPTGVRKIYAKYTGSEGRDGSTIRAGIGEESQGARQNYIRNAIQETEMSFKDDPDRTDRMTWDERYDRMMWRQKNRYDLGQRNDAKAYQDVMYGAPWWGRAIGLGNIRPEVRRPQPTGPGDVGASLSNIIGRSRVTPPTSDSSGGGGGRPHFVKALRMRNNNAMRAV